MIEGQLPENLIRRDSEKLKRIVAAASLLAAGSISARANTVDIIASQDATLLGGSDATTDNSLSDPGIFVGTDGQGNPKRGLIEFNVSGAVPAGAIITSAELELTVGQVAGSAGGSVNNYGPVQTIGLFDETQKWGQPSNFAGATSFGGHGHGAAPDAGDATWNYAFYGSMAWNAAGGNWSSSSTDLADAQVPGTNGYLATWSSTGMVADVQNWLENPTTNDGWLIKNSDETDSTDFRAFWSWQGAANTNSPVVAPELVVSYVSSAQNLVWNGSTTAGGDRKTWDVGNNTNWNNGSGSVAYTDGSSVTFDNSLVSTNQAVVLNTLVSPASVTVNNSSGSYMISGTGGITGSTGVVKMGTQKLTLGIANTYTGGTIVNGGILELATADALPKNTALTVAAGASVVIANHGTIATFVPAISALNNDGTMDITNNAMMFQNSSAATIFDQIQSAYANGNWNGTRSSGGVITSSAAASDTTHLTAVGFATGLSTFEGQSVDSTDVLIKYTYYGDANLDGTVDGSDYSRVDNGFLSGLTGWWNGDFNYDGVVNGSDYTLIDNAFNTQAAAIAASITSPTAVITAPLAGSTISTFVPEPAGLAWIALANCFLLTRPRRKTIYAMRFGSRPSRPTPSAGFTLVQLLVVIAIFALLIAVLVPLKHRLREQSNLARCKDNLRNIGSNLLLYAHANRGDFPMSSVVENPHSDLLECLAAQRLGPTPATYYCPSEHRPALSFSQENFSVGVIGYYYFSAFKLSSSVDPSMSKFLRNSISWPRRLNSGMDVKTWIMSDIWVSSQPTAHTAYKKGVNYLMLDGSVGFVPESPRQQFH